MGDDIDESLAIDLALLDGRRLTPPLDMMTAPKAGYY